MEQQLTPHDRNYEPRYCNACGYELEDHERYTCDDCEEYEDQLTDENLEL